MNQNAPQLIVASRLTMTTAHMNARNAIFLLPKWTFVSAHLAYWSSAALLRCPRHFQAMTERSPRISPGSGLFLVPDILCQGKSPSTV